MSARLQPGTRRAIAEAFAKLDYRALGPIYCHEGGDAFWKSKRRLCQRLGSALAARLRRRLKRKGRSLYVGAGVAEIPALSMETVERDRQVVVFNLRAAEVRILNQACAGLPLRFETRNAATVRGIFDHLWLVSVLNDPECYPELSDLSYGRANPATFDPRRFARERRDMLQVLDRCLRSLARPGLVTTSTEEAHWIADWCTARKIPWHVERGRYPSPTVGDPICFMRIGEKGK
ncbi:hypothetical protein YTPLAS18_01770 [Nitrospira sp.]|nr:hypothetical protein YTPLAS18_01770 [Nitrospira sp.]